MKSNQNFKLVFLVLVINIFFLTFSSNIYPNYNRQGNIAKIPESKEDLEIKTPKSAGYWSLGPIYVNEMGDSWLHYATTYDWCNGNGSWMNPFLLENITIDAGGGGYGIQVEETLGNYFIIRNCTIYNTGFNPLYGGIRILGMVSNGILINNNISNNQYNGIYMNGCFNITIKENILTNNLGGINFAGPCTNNLISRNIITDNSNGFYIDGATTNDIITENTIIDNTVGIHSWSDTSGYHFYYNYFSNTANVVGDGMGTNYFNSSTVGNYWHNYAGTDGDGDGIGDSAYNTGEGWDYLPICDNLEPNITIINPNPGQICGIQSPIFEVQINETFLESMWYSLDGGLTNTTFTSNGTIKQEIWDSLSNGTHNLEFYAEDFVHNIGNKSLKIHKDIIFPEISINKLSLQINTPPTFNISIEEPNLDDCWYTMDGGMTNWTVSNLCGIISEQAWDLVSDGIVTIRFYANDTAGNEGYEQILVLKHTYETPEDNGETSPADPTILIILLGTSIAAISIIVIAASRNLLFGKLKRE